MDVAAANANNDVAQRIADSTPMRSLQRSSGLIKTATKAATPIIWQIPQRQTSIKMKTEHFGLKEETCTLSCKQN
jgi:hypothetical protein